MVGKEFLSVLHIANIYFRDFGGITTIIRLINFSNTKCTVFSGNDLPGVGKLVIEIKENLTSRTIELFVSPVKDFTENNTFTLFYEDPLPADFEEKVNKLNDILIKSENRKELRYEVGLKNWQNFGLQKPDTYFLDGTIPVKNIISNASIHGVLLTGNRSHVKIGDKVIFECMFKNGMMKQPSIIINADVAAQTYFRYSLRFLEPLSLSWCNHIIEYGDYLDNLLL